MRALLIALLSVAFAACTDRSISPIVPEALEVGKPYTVFVASSRAREDDGTFGFRRAEKLSLLELTVSIPPTHKPGNLAFSYANPNPKRQFTLAGQREFPGQAEFNARLAEQLRARPPQDREVVIFVHGYNTTQNETAFRAAQLGNDIQIPGQLLMYSWPSRGKAFAYAYDLDSMLFARDGLEDYVRQVKKAGAKRVLLVAHSMGSALSMEMLRQVESKDPGWANRTFDGVVLISPDLSVDVFRTQIAALHQVPEPFVVLVSEKDKALDFSALLRGTGESERLGNISSTEKLTDLPISIIDTTAFSDDAASSHFVAATSPSLLAMLNSARSMSRTLGPESDGFEALIPPTRRNPNGLTEVRLDPVHNRPGEDR